MDAQIERLADLSGFLKLASVPDWQRVRLRPAAHRSVSAGLSAEGRGAEWPAAAADSTAAAGEEGWSHG